MTTFLEQIERTNLNVQDIEAIVFSKYPLYHNNRWDKIEDNRPYSYIEAKEFLDQQV